MGCHLCYWFTHYRHDAWRRRAISTLWNERKKLGHTPLHYVKAPGLPSVQFVFKNETASPTRSVKHRFVWALMMWALLEGHIKPNTTVYEATDGNSGIAEAYFCRLLGLNSAVIVPDTIQPAKEKALLDQNARIIKVPASDLQRRARQEADKNGGFYMNQFGNAGKALEYHESASRSIVSANPCLSLGGNNGQESMNLMHEIKRQLGRAPELFVHSAATGGTITSVGRYVKKYGLPTQIVESDSEFSVYYDYVASGKFANVSGANQWVDPGIAGTGFGNMGVAVVDETTSLRPSIIDRVVKVPDLGSVASLHFLRSIGVDAGPSTGLDFLAALSVAAKESRKKRPRATAPIRIALILGDLGSPYNIDYYNRTWVAEKFAPHGGLPVFDCWLKVVTDAYKNGSDPLMVGKNKCPSPLQKKRA
ncbi:Protein T25D3.3 [Aphelenchoides avenae]|nr:Protein T25D3.3 [Aphelenchus avenae]